MFSNLARSTLFAALLFVGGAVDARLWTSAGGNFQVEAELVEVKADKVVLKRPDGQLLEIEISKLSPADQRFLRGMKPAPNPAVPKPPPITKPGPADPAPRPPEASANLTAPPKAESAKFQTAIDDYWAALKNHDLADAEKQLETARALTLSTADAAALARLESHFQVMQQFWSSFQQFAARLPAGGELPVGSEVVAIVESEGGRLIVRALGRNCRFTLNNTPSIPAKLAVAVVEKGTKPGGGIVTLFRALGSEGTDPDRWRAAAGVPPGANPGVLGGDPRPAAPKPAGKKLPLPSAADRETAKKQFTELFGKEITAAKTNAQKFELANKWYELADQTYPQEPATCFVLVNEASDVAGTIGYAVGGHQIAEWLLDRYEIEDPLKVRIAFLLKTGKSVTDPQQGQAAVQWALEVAEAAATAGKFDQIEAIMQVAQTSARTAKNKELLQTVLDKKKTLEEAQAAEGEMTQVRQTLAANADDPQANHKLGMYLASFRQSWKDALPHLAKSSEAGVSAAAKLDLANPTDPAKQVEAGDGWWNLAEAAKMGAHHEAYLARAVHWYQLAAPKLNGLAKIKVEKRLAPKP